MRNPVQNAVDQLREAIYSALKKAVTDGALPQPAEGAFPEFVVEIPADTSFGDFASNIAMVSAKTFRKAPRQIADALLDRIELPAASFERVEIAGPGFLNFFLQPGWFGATVQEILEDGEDFGKTGFGKNEKIMVEFVSANPTGPMHMGNARGGALGDSLAGALEAAGYEVTREFYLNDAGNQVKKFGDSLYARYLQIYQGEDAVPFPEDGYHGEDIRERAKEFAAQHGDAFLKREPEEAKKALVAYALPENVRAMEADLSRYRVEYDVWFRESALHENGAIDRILGTLKKKDLIFEKDGAVWYRATAFGGEKDEVLIRQNGEPTYFAADIAYHYNKFAERGFSRVINVWGADHHGHVARLKGALDALGLDGSRLEILLMQLVRLMKDGEPYRMSKRTGKSITLHDLLEEIPIDAARFFFNLREAGSALDFDLDLAAEQSSQNPVYYVQYAHARICSIVRKLEEEGIRHLPKPEDFARLGTPEEKELIRFLARTPNEIIDAARTRDPARLTRFCIDLSTLFHKFYTECRVNCGEECLTQARLSLCLASRQTLRNLLKILKVAAPETM